MRTYNFDNYKTVAILGSFGKHYDLIVDVAHFFEANNLSVLVPKLSGIKDDSDSYIILNDDESLNPKDLEYAYLSKCLEADLVYVVNKDGYIGTTVAFELGLLVNSGQEIILMEEPSDKLFYSMLNSGAVLKPDELVQKVRTHNDTFNSREYFDSFHKFELLPFSLVRNKNDKIE